MVLATSLGPTKENQSRWKRATEEAMSTRGHSILVIAENKGIFTEENEDMYIMEMFQRLRTVEDRDAPWGDDLVLTDNSRNAVSVYGKEGGDGKIHQKLLKTLDSHLNQGQILHWSNLHLCTNTIKLSKLLPQILSKLWPTRVLLLLKCRLLPFQTINITVAVCAAMLSHVNALWPHGL